MDEVVCGCCGQRHDEIGLTLAQAAAIRGVSERTIARRVASGQLPTVLFGRSRRIRPGDLHSAFRARP